jgi:hypothetical protein
MSDLDPGQREHDLSEALITLIIAASRYGRDDNAPRSTVDRIASLEQIVALVADGIEERIRNIRGDKAAARIRRKLHAGPAPCSDEE